jgi:hypothetical protein
MQLRRNGVTPQLEKTNQGNSLVEEAPDTPFEKLLDPIDGLDNVLKEVDSSPRLEQPRLLFLRFRQQDPELDALAELLTDLLVEYAIPLNKRQQANVAGSNSATKGNTVMHVRLYREAKRLLIEYEQANQGRYGELGELLSYALAVHYLRSPANQSQMRTESAQMNVSLRRPGSCSSGLRRATCRPF